MAKKRTTRRANGWKAWHKRLVSGAIFIFCLVMVLALITGKQTLQQDFQALKDSGSVFNWFSTAKNDTSNLAGFFGIVIGSLVVWFMGHFFSLVSFALLGLISLLYFINPRAIKARQKIMLLLITAFLLQILISGGSQNGSYELIPASIGKLLAAMFSDNGAAIILIVSMILSLFLIFGWERIKKWGKLASSIFLNWRAQDKPIPAKKQKPTINRESKADKEKPAAEPTPVIKDHNVQEENKPPADDPIIDPLHPLTPPKTKPKKEKDYEAEEEEDTREYVMPSIGDYLESPIKLSERDRKEIENQILSTSSILKDKLGEFGIEAEVRNVNIGPIITQYELEPAKGVKVNRFTSLADDIALAIKAKSIRVQAPIPGRGLIGIEIPNLSRDMIYLKDLLLCDEMRNASSKLMFGLGKDIAGKPVVADLAKMPHLLIAGATGSGKSVCINTIIMSLILRTTPDDLRLILIDPKRVELAGYNELPHLIGNVVTDPDNALENMYWAVREMERRYELLQELKVRDIGGYNEKAAQEEDAERLPYIVIIVDEFADLIMTSGKDIELPITRLAQMARAVGIHLILATQRPSIKVITGIIKANFPTRIAFQVSSRVDSRVILDSIGAERLLGSGDMLFMPPGKAIAERIHGAYVSDSEIARVCDFLGMQPKPRMDFSLPTREEGALGSIDYDDELFPEAASVVVRANMASVSMLQRHFKIGYARAGRLIDLLEQAQIVGPHLGSKSRDVLATREDLIRMGLVRDDT